MFDVHAIKGSTTVIDDTDTSEILSKNKTSFNFKIKFKYTVFIQAFVEIIHIGFSDFITLFVYYI